MNGFDKAIKDTGGPYLHFARLATISGDQKVCLVHCSARHLKKWAQVQDGELASNKHQGSQIIENMNNALCNPNDVSVLLTFIMFFLIVQKLMVIDMMPCTSTPCMLLTGAILSYSNQLNKDASESRMPHRVSFDIFSL